MLSQAARIFALLSSAFGVCAGSNAYEGAPSQHVLEAEGDGHGHGHGFPVLNFSSSSPLIFQSTYGLLQQWTNDFFPTGHTIAAGTIGKNTNLYHGRPDGDLPPSPEWLAFDAEMSYAILGWAANSHMLTYRTTRPVKVIYFDGASSALYPEGTMDSQMLFLRNDSAHMPDEPILDPPLNPCPFDGKNHTNCTEWYPLQAEYDRATGLCGYIANNSLGGPGWGFEGIVRMNTGFELIWCNFSSPSLRLVSQVKSSAPALTGLANETATNSEPALSEVYLRGRNVRQLAHALEVEPWPIISEPFFFSSWSRWFIAAAKRYGFTGGTFGRGEARVRLDPCHLFTFYDAGMSDQESARVAEEARKLNLTSAGFWQSPSDESERAIGLQKLGRRRHNHRILNVSAADGQFMKNSVTKRLHAALNPNPEACTGIDWIFTAQEILLTYSTELHELSAILSSLTTPTPSLTLRATLAKTRHLTHTLTSPHYAYPHWTPANLTLAFSPSAPASKTALRLCSAQHSPPSTPLLASERTTSHAMTEIQSSVCSTLLRLFLAVESTWLTHFNDFTAPLPNNSTQHAIRQEAAIWFRELEALRSWLGWTEQWVQCAPPCGLGEYCYVPTWPVGLRVREGGGTEEDFAREEEEMFYRPVCVGGEGRARGR